MSNRSELDLGLRTSLEQWLADPTKAPTREDDETLWCYLSTIRHFRGHVTACSFPCAGEDDPRAGEFRQHCRLRNLGYFQARADAYERRALQHMARLTCGVTLDHPLPAPEG